MFYLYFLAISAVEILVESWLSARNSHALIQKGAIEVASALLPIMALLYLLMYLGSWAEHIWMQRAFSLNWAMTFGSLYLLAKIIKFWAISSLGPLWTMRVLILRSSSVVTKGPYRWIRHPNYVAVLMEIAATTLIGKSFYTFVVVIALFSVTLMFRIQYEEAALKRFTNYSERMDSHRRFLP